MKRYLIIPAVAIILIISAYQLFIYVDNNFRYGRMWETPAVRPHEQPPLIMEEGVVPTSGGEAFFRLAEAGSLQSPLSSTDPQTIIDGKNQYFLYCAQCHGKYLDGNGTVGQSFHPLPGDLRSPQVQSKPEGLLFKEISYGTSKPDSRQPPLAGTISVSDRWRIIAYLKSLGPRN